MGGLSLFRKFLVLSLFTLFSANLFAQTNFTISLSLGANAAEPATNGNVVATISPSIPVGYIWDIPACIDVQGGTATEGVDFETLDVSADFCSPGEYEIYFYDGQSSVQVPVNVLDDSEYEGNETVTLAVTDATVWCECSETASPGGSPVTVNIADDETPPVNYTINLAAGADAAEPSTDGYFTATVSPIPPVEFDGTVVACIGVTGGTATEGVDFEAIGASQEGCPFDNYEVWFENNEWSFDIPINVLDDADYEGTETVTVGVTQASVWSNNSDTASAGTPATLDIEDDDDYATFTVYQWFSDGNPTPVDVSVSCTDATVGQSSQQASFNSPAVFNLTDVGPSNTCSATASTISGYTTEAYNCTNQAVAPTADGYCYFESYYDGITVEVRAKRSASEPKKDSAFELILSGSPPWGGMDVNLSVGGTATPDADYEEIADTINVPYGAMVFDVPVKVLDDEDEEPVETIVLTVLEGDIDYQNCGEYAQTASGRGKSGKQENGCDPYYTPGEQSEASMNLFDDDKPTVSIERKGDAAEPNTLGAFILNLGEAAPAGGLNINLQIGGTAVAGEDYESLDNPVFVPAGSIEHELAVIPIDDDEIEQSETVQVTVMPGEGYIFATGSAGQAVVNIADDDTEEPPFSGTITVSPTSGLVTDEDGATAQFSVVLTSPPTAPVSIAMESSDTTEGTINPMALEFNTFNWNTPQAVTVTGQSDDEQDGDQAYTVMVKPAVSNDGNYAGIDPPDVSVVNTDTTPQPADPASAQFTQGMYSVEEVEGVAQISVKRVGNPDVALAVHISTVDNSEGTTATAGEDYTPLSNVDVSWAAGDTDDKVVEITVFENVDTVTGENETVELLLSGPDMDDQTASLEIISDVGDDLVGGITDDQLPPNQQDIVSVILDTCPKGGNEEDFQGLCTALVFSAADGNSVSDAIKQATPDDAAAVRSSGMQTTNVQVTAVDGRLGTLRGGGGAGFSASGFSMNYGEFAMSGSLMKSFITAFDQNNPDFMQNNANQDDSSILDDFGRWGAWITGRVVFGEKDPTTNQVEYDFDTAGVTFGLDYRFTNEFVAGVAVGYANTDAKLGKNNGELDSKGYSVSLYGTWFKSDRFYMGGSLGYGSNDYDHQRNVRYTIERPERGADFLPDFVFDVDQTLGAEYDGSQFSASLSGGWDFNKKGWTFGPTLSVSYINVDVDDYDEFLLSSNMPQSFASSGWAVHIDDQSYESLQPAIGFAFTKAVSASWGVFIPQGYVDVVSELKDGGSLVTGQFIGDNNNARFALETDDFKETFVRAGLGFGLILKNNKSAFLMVDGDFGRDLLSTYYINAGFRWQF